MKIIICGSMAFSKEMVAIGEGLKKIGHEIVLPRNCENYAESRLQAQNSNESIKSKIEHNLIRDYYNEIERSDGVLIVNYDKKGIKNYLGGNAFLELSFGHILNKKIFLLNEIPDVPYKDEIIAMQPIILNGDLEKIK
jgi:predicted RNA-binding protein with PUA domain